MLERENENISVQFIYYLSIDALSQACSISNKVTVITKMPPDNASVSYGQYKQMLIIFDRFNLDWRLKNYTV